MVAIQLNNNLGLAPPQAKPSIQPIDVAPPVTPTHAPRQPLAKPAGLTTEFAFELPTGYLDGAGQVHCRGVMRLARTVDEIEPMSDMRVQANPAYATVIILSRVILSLGTLPDVSPIVIENLFAGDLNYLQNFYREINNLGE